MQRWNISIWQRQVWDTYSWKCIEKLESFNKKDISKFLVVKSRSKKVFFVSKLYIFSMFTITISNCKQSVNTYHVGMLTLKLVLGDCQAQSSLAKIDRCFTVSNQELQFDFVLKSNLATKNFMKSTVKLFFVSVFDFQNSVNFQLRSIQLSLVFFGLFDWPPNRS